MDKQTGQSGTSRENTAAGQAHLPQLELSGQLRDRQIDG